MIVSVVYGGKEEREASAKNAKDISEVLESLGYTVHLIEFSRDIISKLKELRTDVVYVCVQGKGYGDGTLQGMLEHEGIPFTGSGMRAACLINDKILCKLLFDREGIPTPKWDILTKKQFSQGNYPFEEFGFPFVAKAPTQGGSYGIELIRSSDDIPRIEKVFAFDDPILIERFISGEFYTVGFYESNSRIIKLPVVKGLDLREKNTADYDLISFTGEYGIQECALPKAIMEEISQIAEKVFEVTGAQGLARVDFMADNKEQRPYVLEINAVPGLKKSSLMPREAALAGIVYEDMIEDILKSAFQEELSNA